MNASQHGGMHRAVCRWLAHDSFINHVTASLSQAQNTITESLLQALEELAYAHVRLGGAGCAVSQEGLQLACTTIREWDLRRQLIGSLPWAATMQLASKMQQRQSDSNLAYCPALRGAP
jgi:hypothetical protein